MLLIKEKIKLFFSKGLFHIFTGSLLTRFVSFFASIVVVRILTKNDYGILSYYENLYNYFFLLAGYGLVNSVVRYVVISDSIDEKFSVVHFSKVNGNIFNCFLILVGILFTLVYRHPQQFASHRWFLVLMLLFLPFQYLVNLDIRTERAFYDNKRFAIVSFLYSVSIVLFKLSGAMIWQLFGAICFPLVVHLVYSFIISLSDKKKYFSNAQLISISSEKSKEINKYAVQYMITNGLWAIFTLNSTFILGKTIGKPELLADYKIASVIPGLLSIISSSFGIYVSPYFAKNENKNNYLWVRKNWSKVMILSSIAIGVTVVFLYFFAPVVIDIVFSNKYSSSYPIMRLLLISAFFDGGIRYPTSNLLASMNKIRYNMMVSVLGIILQLILATYLVSKYSVFGIAIANIVVQIFMAVLINLLFFYYFFIKNKYKN